MKRIMDAEMKIDRPQGMALVTGSSSGIGLAYAKELARRGYDLLLVSNEQERLQQVADELSKAFGVGALPLYMDLARPEAARELYDHCKKEHLEIEVLVNNAGVFFFDDLTEVAASRIETMIMLHVHTVTMLCHYFGAEMRQRGKGYILNMSSMSAWTPAPGISVYGASKSYLRKLSQMLRYELRGNGVYVTAVCPGAVATGLYNLSEKYQRLALRLGVMMTPERLARKAIRALFAHKDYILPGGINRFVILLLYLLPAQIIYWLKGHTKLYRYGR